MITGYYTNPWFLYQLITICRKKLYIRYDSVAINNCFNALVMSLFGQLTRTQKQAIIQNGKWLGKEFLHLDSWKFVCKLRTEYSGLLQIPRMAIDGICLSSYAAIISGAYFILLYTVCFEIIHEPTGVFQSGNMSSFSQTFRNLNNNAITILTIFTDWKPVLKSTWHYKCVHLDQ